MKILRKSIWNASYFSQIGIVEGRNKIAGSEMLIEIEFKDALNRLALKKSLRWLIETFPHLQTLWACIGNTTTFEKIPADQANDEIDLLETLLDNNYSRSEAFYPLTENTVQSQSRLPFRCVTIADDVLIVSAMHTHFHGISMYAYIDILLHRYYFELGDISSEEMSRRIELFSRSVPKLLGLVHGFLLPWRFWQVTRFLKEFQKKALLRSKDCGLPSWTTRNQQHQSEFVRRHWTLEEQQQAKLLKKCKEKNQSPSQYIVQKCAEEFLFDQERARKGCFFYMPTNEVRNTPGASILHMGSHVGSFWIQYQHGEDLERSTKSQWSQILEKNIPFWLMIFLGMRTKNIQHEIERRAEKIYQFIPHELDEFSNADMVISNGGKAPQSPVNKYIENMKTFGKSFHYPFLVVTTFEEKMNFLLTYNAGIYNSEIEKKMERIINNLETDIVAVGCQRKVSAQASLGAGFATIQRNSNFFIKKKFINSRN